MILPDTTAGVVADLEARHEMGLEKYGTTLADGDYTRRELAQHAYEEALDLACYLKTLLNTIDAEGTDRLKHLRKKRDALEREIAEEMNNGPKDDFGRSIPPAGYAPKAVAEEGLGYAKGS